MLIASPTLPARRNAQRGLSLIESLVAMLVLALGIAGLALVQARLLVDSRAASGRSVALTLVDDLANRMMFNRDTAASNGYKLAWGEIPAARDCSMASCSGSELAQADLNAWRLAVKTALPMGNAAVFRSAQDPRQIGIAISWALNESKAVDVDTASYRKPFTVTTTTHGIDCPVSALCHVAYVQP